MENASLINFNFGFAKVTITEDMIKKVM